MAHYLSLFSGCGGFDYGFSKYFDCIGAYDFEKSAVETFSKNFKKNIYLHDLTDLNLPNLKQAKKADILLSGSPCQGFSTVGKRDLDDPRNHLLFTAPDMAERVNPKVVVCENVPAVKSGLHAQYWSKLIKRFHGLGYNTEEFVYNFYDHGIAQMRKRIFLIAYKGKKVDRELLMIPEKTKIHLGDVITGVDKHADHIYRKLEKETDLMIAKKIKPGQKLSNVRSGPASVHSWEIPDVFGDVSISEKKLLESIISIRRRCRVRDTGDADPVTIDVLEKHYPHSFRSDLKALLKKGYLIEKSTGYFDLCGTFNGKYRRLKLDEPSFTVDTNFGNPRYFLHPTEHRGFSIREAARIQSFPDDFIFEGNISQKFKMIGNAVPPLISEQIAHSVYEVFFGGK